jgi:AhpD family alkylhydroperoxidase
MQPGLFLYYLWWARIEEKDRLETAVAGIDFGLAKISLEKKESNVMDERTRELIAIGASVGAHCQPCLAWHVDKARELGIDDETIRAAIEVGHMVDKGAMSAMRKFSAEILTQEAAPEAACCSGGNKGGGSCCG